MCISYTYTHWHVCTTHCLWVGKVSSTDSTDLDHSMSLWAWIGTSSLPMMNTTSPVSLSSTRRCRSLRRTGTPARVLSAKWTCDIRLGLVPMATRQAAYKHSKSLSKCLVDTFRFHIIITVHCQDHNYSQSKAPPIPSKNEHPWCGGLVI